MAEEKIQQELTDAWINLSQAVVENLERKTGRGGPFTEEEIGLLFRINALEAVEQAGLPPETAIL